MREGEKRHPRLGTVQITLEFDLKRQDWPQVKLKAET